MDYKRLTALFKAMAEPNRIKIVQLLSFSSMCACDVLAHFDFTQPTLSHHMKILENCGMVTVTKRCQWHYYALNHVTVQEFMNATGELFSTADIPNIQSSLDS